jgi:hypothetical protein
VKRKPKEPKYHIDCGWLAFLDAGGFDSDKHGKLLHDGVLNEEPN